MQPKLRDGERERERERGLTCLQNIFNFSSIVLHEYEAMMLQKSSISPSLKPRSAPLNDEAVLLGLVEVERSVEPKKM
jgi:hypothetical protein